jgi:hypothetical protein
MLLKYTAPIALALLAGCATLDKTGDSVKNLFSGTGQDSIRIESEPSGAAVYVMGKNVGTTPLSISSKDVFPLTYPKEKESLYGSVTLIKSGCADYTKPVSARVLDKGLKATLACNDAAPVAPRAAPAASAAAAPAQMTGQAQPAVPAAVPAAAPAATPAAAAASDAVEQRLEKIKRLLDRGLINEDEAKKARERVLNDL